MKKIKRIIIIEFDSENDDFINDWLKRYDKVKKSEIIYEDLVIECSPFKIDYRNKKIFKNGKVLKLTRMEFEVMNLFLTNPKRVYSKEQIYEAIWKETSESCVHAVENMISRLRKKIEDNSSKSKYIITVKGFGYKFNKKEN